MAYKLWFGKYNGTSLEEVAMGKRCPGGGGKQEGYSYFYALGKGDRKYFGMFQNQESSMRRWNEIHDGLNNFVSPCSCAVCGKFPAEKMSVAGSGRYGFSMGKSYICCNDDNCVSSMTSMTSTSLYPIAFDTILKFGWGAGSRKFDEEMVADLLKELAGWTAKRITPDNATEFIDRLTIRG